MVPLVPSITHIPLHFQDPAFKSMPISLLLNFPMRIITTMLSMAPILGQHPRQLQKTSRLRHIPSTLLMVMMCTVKNSKRALLATTRPCRRIWWQVYRTYVVSRFLSFPYDGHSEKHDYRALTPAAHVVLDNTTALAENGAVLPVAVEANERASRSGSAGKATKSNKKPGK